MSELSQFQEEVGEWGDETFNHSFAHGSVLSLTAHMEKEIGEFKDEYHSCCIPTENAKINEEIADCFILLLNIDKPWAQMGEAG
jgi:hypothetical protein